MTSSRPFSTISRRDFLVAAGVAGTVAVSLRAAAEQSPGDPMAVPDQLDTRDPDHNLVTYMKILSDLSGRPTYRFHTGRILSVAPGQLGQPFMDFVACKQDRVRRLTDGSYQHGYRGVILFTEVDTGRVLDTFENPLTGKTNRVQHFRTQWGSGVFTRHGAYSLAAAGQAQEAPGLRDKPFQLGWTIVGDDVWVTYDERVAVRDAGGAIVYADSSMYRYHASLGQLKDPEQPSADTVMSWNTETTWWPWMDMGDTPGHLIFGSMGRKFADLAEVPEQVISASEEIFPGQLSRPIDWSDYTLPDPALAPGKEISG